VIAKQIEQIQRRIDRAKNPKGYRDLVLLKVCEEMLAILRELNQVNNPKEKKRANYSQR
jgi:hypothetical protein